MFRAICAAALAAAAIPALAQESETSKLREEVQQLQQRLDTLEAQSNRSSSSPSAFNPEISAILNGIYSNLQRDPTTYQLTGFVPTLGDVAPPRRGLSLGESELALASNVDHLFRG